ncbi:MAG: type II toxin-antitoxin system ParD family antitoxin [Planctomycetes bacterium]|nr:type II toxin-antitoxin system ParD family antitoxin [Planctomycetota bacterium]
MNVSLTTKLNQFVKKQIESGRYASASEVVRDGLRLLEDQERVREIRLRELRKEIKKGIVQIDRGDYTVVTKKNMKRFFEEVKEQGRERLAAQSRNRTARR